MKEKRGNIFLDDEEAKIIDLEFLELKKKNYRSQREEVRPRLAPQPIRVVSLEDIPAINISFISAKVPQRSTNNLVQGLSLNASSNPALFKQMQRERDLTDKTCTDHCFETIMLIDDA